MRGKEMVKGKFITFEGCEGSGKSTQLRLLSEYLDKHNIPYVLTREPGGSAIAEKIREIILDGKNTEMCDGCEALLYAAARMQHLKDTVAPALESGKLVVCDRYVDSSLAYQGEARGLGMEYVGAINALALEKYRPDLTVFLDIPPDKAFRRKHGADKNDRMEMQGMEFHMRVYGGYKKLLAKYPRICAVECNGTKFQTHENIIALLKDKGII
ncbi:MAG: dTMP kinase [Clostridia bacterium]|nr:dTMP kinase [Clostridia bacterium]